MIRWNTRRLSAPEGDPGASNPGTPPAATPPIPPKQVTVDDLPPEALKARLEQAKSAAQKELLDSLGITDPAQAKAAIEAAKAAEEAKKSHETRLAEQSLKLTSQEAGLAAAIEAFSALITPEQKAAIDDVAGPDKSAWLKTYKAMSKTWAAPAAPATTTVTPAASPVVEAPPAAPATTSPPAAAPPPAGSTSPPDIKQTHETLKQRNPIVAACFADKNSKALYGS